MGFSSKLTEEEDFLRKKYAVLRKKKKRLQQLRLKRKQQEAASAENHPNKSKQKMGLIKSAKDSSLPIVPERKMPESKYIDVVNAAANTEAAKKLIKSGAIKLKAENKTTFKRSLSKKKRDSKKTKELFKPFEQSTTSSDQEDEKETASATLSSPPDKKPNKNFTSPRKEGRGNFRKEKKFDRGTQKKGNTIYIHGYALSEKLMRDNFTKFGTILDVNVEKNERSAFVTFNSLEAAEVAIDKMDSALVAGTRLKVSLARRQPMLESVISDSPWSALATGQGDKGSSHKDKRALVVYDDDLFN